LAPSPVLVADSLGLYGFATSEPRKAPICIPPASADYPRRSPECNAPLAARLKMFDIPAALDSGRRLPFGPGLSSQADRLLANRPEGLVQNL